MSSTARYAIHQLVQMGITHFCICPGSRSTELTATIARHPQAQSHIFHDERSATFCALGFGLSGTIAALVVTSGTAVANAFPAIIEASKAGVPLLVLTADRPAELRDSSANQTIDQVKIFGQYVRFFFDIPCDPNYPLQALQNILSYAVSKCDGIHPGPVHLNWMFREPFDVSHTPIETIQYPIINSGILHLPDNIKHQLMNQIQESVSGILVIGSLTDPNEIKSISKWISKINWPIIVDSSSGLRLMGLKNMFLAWEDVLACRPEKLQPDIVIQLGDGLCSKRYEEWIRTLSCPIWVLNPYPILSNPSATAIIRCQTHIQTLVFLSDICTHSDLLTLVLKHNLHTLSILQQNVLNSYNEISIAQTTIECSPKNGQVFISNSMPIRDVNNYVFSEKYLLSASNRGASGIDGIISTATGWLIGNQRPTVLIIGDLALMHDWGVLFSLVHKPLSHPLIVLVINNGGGGIFSMLPISKQEDIFEDHFATAHPHQYTTIINAMGIKSIQVGSLKQLQHVVNDAYKRPQLTIIETNTVRSSGTELRLHLRSLIQEPWKT